MKKFIGLIVSLIIIVASIVIFNGTSKYLGSFVGVLIGIIITVILHGISKYKYASSIISATVIAIIGSIILLFMVTVGYLGLVEVHDFFAIEHTLDLKSHTSYTIDTSVIKKEATIQENVPFTYFLRLSISDHRIRDNLLNEYVIELPEELLTEIASSDNINHVILSFGRKLKEIKYKYLGYFSNGSTSKATVIFSEEYQDDMMYVYFVKKDVFFWEVDYYVIENDKKVYLGKDIRLINSKMAR